MTIPQSCFLTANWPTLVLFSRAVSALFRLRTDMFTRVVPVWLTLIIILGPLNVKLRLMKVNPFDLVVCPPT